MTSISDSSNHKGLLKIGALALSTSFLIWSLSYILWPGLFSSGGIYQVTPLFGVYVYFENTGFLFGISLSIALTAAGIACLSVWAKGRIFKGKTALLLSFLLFVAFQALQAWQVYRYNYPLGSYFSLTGNSSTVTNGLIIDSIGIAAYLIIFSIPAMVLGNTYSRILCTAAFGLSIWLYWSTHQALFYIFSHGNIPYHYFGYLPFSPYFGGLEGLLVNYRIPPYTVYSNDHLYLIISGFLFFVSYFLIFVSKNRKLIPPSVN